MLAVCSLCTSLTRPKKQRSNATAENQQRDATKSISHNGMWLRRLFFTAWKANAQSLYAPLRAWFNKASSEAIAEHRTAGDAADADPLCLIHADALDLIKEISKKCECDLPNLWGLNHQQAPDFSTMTLKEVSTCITFTTHTLRYIDNKTHKRRADVTPPAGSAAGIPGFLDGFDEPAKGGVIFAVCEWWNSLQGGKPQTLIDEVGELSTYLLNDMTIFAQKGKGDDAKPTLSKNKRGHLANAQLSQAIKAFAYDYADLHVLWRLILVMANEVGADSPAATTSLPEYAALKGDTVIHPPLVRTKDFLEELGRLLVPEKAADEQPVETGDQLGRLVAVMLQLEAAGKGEEEDGKEGAEEEGEEEGEEEEEEEEEGEDDTGASPRKRQKVASSNGADDKDYLLPLQGRFVCVLRVHLKRQGADHPMLYDLLAGLADRIKHNDSSKLDWLVDSFFNKLKPTPREPYEHVLVRNDSQYKKFEQELCDEDDAIAKYVEKEKKAMEGHEALVAEEAKALLAYRKVRSQLREMYEKADGHVASRAAHEGHAKWLRQTLAGAKEKNEKNEKKEAAAATAKVSPIALTAAAVLAAGATVKCIRQTEIPIKFVPHVPAEAKDYELKMLAVDEVASVIAQYDLVVPGATRVVSLTAVERKGGETALVVTKSLELVVDASMLAQEVDLLGDEY